MKNLDYTNDEGGSRAEKAIAVDSTAKKETKVDFGCHYDSVKRHYLVQKPDGRWLTQTVGQLRRRLKKAGMASTENQDEWMIGIEDEREIRYAGPLAGKRDGFYEENGIRFLVTESPTLIEPVPGEWGTLKAVIRGLLVEGEDRELGETQWHTVLGWLKSAVEALREGRHQQAQVMAIAGVRDCGKSLFQHLITLMLGGRSAKGARYMMGRTEFNAELFEAEHIMLEDESMSASKTHRERLGAAFKQFTVSSRIQSCHPKKKTAVNLPVFWRVSVTLNDEPDSLRVLPPLDEHIEDKVILLRAFRFEMPMSTKTGEEQETFLRTLTGEIPAFLHWLIHDCTVPKAYRDRRYLVKTWHHPVIREALEKLSSEAELLSMIDEVLWDDPGKSEWTGTANELRQLLLQDGRTATDARRVLRNRNAVGTLLGKLRKKEKRIRPARDADSRWWVIRREPGEAVTQSGSPVEIEEDL